MPYPLVSVGAPDRVHVRLAELVAALSLGVDLGFGHVDSTPMLKGLPGDRCTCPHWGYVFKGRVTYTFDGREEVHEAGDAFYVPGGHLQRADAEPSTSRSARLPSCGRSRRRSCATCAS